MSSTIATTVQVNSDPQQGASFPSGSDRFPFSSSRNYPRQSGSKGFVVTGTDAAPQALPLGAVATGRFLWLRVAGGEVRLRITSPDGATQVIPVTGAFLLDNPLLATDTAAVFTAVTLAGTLVAPATAVEIEYLVAGDA